MRIVLTLLLVAAPLWAQTDELEPAFEVTLRWEGTKVAVEKAERKELAVPTQRGFGQLTPLFLELRSGDGDVYYASALPYPFRNGHGEKAPPHAESKVVVPDIPEARKLVILRRVSTDPAKGRDVLAEHDL